MSTIKTVALYARSAMKNDAAIAAQIDVLTEHATSNGWSIAGEFIDNGVSGNGVRPALAQLLDAGRAEPRPFDAVLVQDIHRFARNIAAHTELLAELDRLGIGIIVPELGVRHAQTPDASAPAP